MDVGGVAFFELWQNALHPNSSRQADAGAALTQNLPERRCLNCCAGSTLLSILWLPVIQLKSLLLVGAGSALTLDPLKLPCCNCSAISLTPLADQPQALQESPAVWLTLWPTREFHVSSM